MGSKFAIENRKDCIVALANHDEVIAGLENKHVVMTGGTGFLGAWIAETISALNDDYHLGISVDLVARSNQHWKKYSPHLLDREDIKFIPHDVRNPIEFNSDTHFIINAAGTPSSRVHSSDPLRVYETITQGTGNCLEAATHLEKLQRIVNVSSASIYGSPNCSGPLKESDSFAIPSGQLHNVYLEGKRGSEMLSSLYRSQFRLPLSTVRPFTLAGAYQPLDRPWAINNFIRDVIRGGDIRLHGDGSARRSYLYGSDAAWWTLSALIKGADGEAYNLGSSEAVSHIELIEKISACLNLEVEVLYNTNQNFKSGSDDLFPDVSLTESRLGVSQTCALNSIIDKTFRWYLHSKN